jgi:hypothetical protein
MCEITKKAAFIMTDGSPLSLTGTMAIAAIEFSSIDSTDSKTTCLKKA